jgi:hypothetical protein
MEAKEFKELLLKLPDGNKACEEARIWADGKSWEEVYSTCHRGDWLLWLFKKVNPDDLQLLTLAKGHCANTVRHLMKDERSIKAVDMAIAYGEGKCTIEELETAYAAAYSAVAYSAATNDAATITKNRQETADICRKYLPIEIWNIK